MTQGTIDSTVREILDKLLVLTERGKVRWKRSGMSSLGVSTRGEFALDLRDFSVVISQLADGTMVAAIYDEAGEETGRLAAGPLDTAYERLGALYDAVGAQLGVREDNLRALSRQLDSL